MDYIAVYTAVLDHPKALRLSDRAFRALVSTWLYAGRHETDGHVPQAAVGLLRMTPRVVLELEQGGWLHRNGSGWEIHDWDHHQQPLEDAQERRRRARTRMRDHRRRVREQERGNHA